MPVKSSVGMFSAVGMRPAYVGTAAAVLMEQSAKLMAMARNCMVASEDLRLES